MAVWALPHLGRITLVVSSAVTALFSLLPITSLASFVIGAGAVIVLLFTGGARAWFAARKNA